MTIPQLRARELAMESLKNVAMFDNTDDWDAFARYHATVVRENEHAIEVAVNDALAEAAA